MSYLFEKIKEQLKNELPFVCYCKPNSDTIISLLQKNDSLIEWNSLGVRRICLSILLNISNFILYEYARLAHA